MSDLEERLRRGHPEEHGHRPPPFAAVAARPRPARASGLGGWSRLASVLAASFAVAVVAVLVRPIGLSDGGAPRELARPESRGPAGTDGQSPSRTRVECGPAGEPECAQIVNAARLAAAGHPIFDVAVRAIVPACVPATACDMASVRRAPWFADIQTESGRIGLLCDAAGGTARCSKAVASELLALATLVVRVEGADRQTVLLRNEGGTVRALDADPTLEQELTVGRWFLTLPDRGCSVELEAGPAERLEVIVRLPSPEPCRIEVR